MPLQHAGRVNHHWRIRSTHVTSEGLVVYDSSDPAAKLLARDAFVKELSQPGHTARIAAKAGDALVAKGYHAQATLADGTVSVFHLNAERAPIRIEGRRRLVQ